MTRLLVAAMAVWLMTACSADVTFSPEEGEERTYWVVNDTRLEGASSNSRALVQYRVEETSSDLRLRLTPHFLELNDGEGRFSSAGPAEERPELYRLLAAGLEMKLDPQTGALRQLRGMDRLTWNTLYRRQGEPLVDGLLRRLGAPMVLASIPARVGAKVALDPFIDMPSELTVVGVTDTTLSAELHTDTADGRVYARLEMERDTGWLKRMLILAELPIGSGRQQREMRLRTLIVPEEAPVGSLAYWLEGGGGTPWFALAESAQPLADMMPPAADRVFADEQGSYRAWNDLVELTLRHDLEGESLPAEMAFTEVRALDADGDPLPLRFASLEGPGLLNLDGQVQSSSVLLPLDWHRQAVFERVRRYRARVAYRPHELQELSVDWEARPSGTRRLERDGVSIAIEPIPGEASLYELRIASERPGQYPLYHLGEVKGELQVLQPEAGPDWLQPGERRLAAFFGGDGGSRWRLRLAQEPERISLFMARPSDSVEERDLHFVSPRAFRADAGPSSLGR